MRQDLQNYLKELEIDPDVPNGTFKVRRAGIKSFNAWLDANDIDTDIIEIKPSIIRSFLKHEKANFALNTSSKRYDTLNELYKFLLIDYPDKLNPIEPLNSSKYTKGKRDKTAEEEARLEKDLPPHITKKEYEMMLDSVAGPKVRNRAMLSLLYFCGLRAGELRALKIHHVDFDDQILTVPDVKTPKRYVPIPAATLNLIDKYLNFGYREGLINEDSPNDYLFISDQNGTKINNSMVRKIVCNAAIDAGIQEILYTDASGGKRYHIHPHIFRHTFMDRMANEKQLPIPVLMKIGGHLDIETVQEYQRQDDREAAERAKSFLISDD